MPKKPIAILADGDVFAFQAAASSEYVSQLGPTYHLMGDMEEAQRHIANNIRSLMKEIKAKKFINTLSCPSRHYWRHDVMPSYKGGRKEYKGPIHLPDLKDWMQEEYETYRWPHMEADDVMGILATDPEFLPEYTKVIVSIDKDMKTIPDVHIFNPDKDYAPWFNKREDADAFFYAQAIGGDTTDGYSGVSGISVDGAAAFLRDPWRWETYEHTFKSGPRKGTSEVRWRKAEPSPDLWTNILSLYAKVGQSEEEALANARVARICTHDLWDSEKQEVILWEPK